MKLPYSSTSALCGDRPLCEYFEAAAALTTVPVKVANWVVNDLLRELGQKNDNEDADRELLTIKTCKVPPENLAELVNLIEDGTISNNVAKELFPEMFAVGKSAKDLIKDKGLEMKSDGNEIEALCSQAISDDPDAAEKFKGGEGKSHQRS